MCFIQIHEAHTSVLTHDYPFIIMPDLCYLMIMTVNYRGVSQRLQTGEGLCLLLGRWSAVPPARGQLPMLCSSLRGSVL